MSAQRAHRGHVPVCGRSHRGEGHVRPEAAAAPSVFASPAPRAPRPGLPHGQLQPWHWPVANTSGELIENKFRLYETEMIGNCLGADTQQGSRAPREWCDGPSSSPPPRGCLKGEILPRRG